MSLGFGLGGGGGIYTSFGSTTVSNSTLSGNTAQYQGGGIFHDSGPLTIVNSTLSGNTANNQGGGIYSRLGQLAVRHSTITGNQALGMNSDPVRPGGGVMRSGLAAYSTNLEHTIVAGNSGQFSGDDLRGSFTARYSLIGIQTGETFIVDNGGNLIGNPGSPINPLLGPLANNGGPTMTHALLAGSPAIDAGDPAAVAGVGSVPLFDQRGDPFTRVFDGDGASGARIDMGRLNCSPPGPALPGDYNRDGVVDAADYVVWRKTLGTTGVPAFSGADGDGDTTIDQDDYGVWRAHFGMTVPAPGAGSAAGVPTLSAPAIQIREPAELLPTETTSAPAETDLTAARAAGFAVLDNPSRLARLGLAITRADPAIRARRVRQRRLAASGDRSRGACLTPGRRSS